MSDRKIVSIATTSRRAEIAIAVARSFYRSATMALDAEVRLGLGFRDSKLGGTAIPLTVARGVWDFGIANPAGLARMGTAGVGPYKKKLSLRAIGVFPSWDRLVFAVRKDSGISSLDEIAARKLPVTVSTRAGTKEHATLYVIGQVLQAYGFSLADIEKWGGKVLRVQSPSDPARREHLQGGIQAVFDEGIKTWGALALAADMKFLPIRDDVLRKMSRLGFGGATLGKDAFPAMDEDIATVDFSGWLFFCRADLPAKTAYDMARAIDRCHEDIEADRLDKGKMTMQEFCRGGESGTLTIPLHSGAKKYYREKGYI
ncbi:MAG TPA: TAXI family TRAP transporter solute-binding subunit [Candidatus Binatia bacterium]|nr:TAXI family TRAP transporter solute-binding subunit [Candidatus Binatia bacterium]